MDYTTGDEESIRANHGGDLLCMYVVVVDQWTFLVGAQVVVGEPNGACL